MSSQPSSSRLPSRNPPHPIDLPGQIIRNAKYVIGGLVGGWYTDLGGVVADVLGVETVGKRSGWNRTTMMVSLTLQSITIAIFLYLVVVLPWFQGYLPNYSSWQKSRRLRILVPALTLTILAGYITLIISISKGSNLGIFKSILGASAMYSLTFGLLGLIPTPSVHGPGRRKVGGREQ